MTGPSIEEQIWGVYADKGLQVLGLDLWNGSHTQLSAFERLTKVTFPLLMRASIGTNFGVQSRGAVDAIMVMDRKGIVQYRSGQRVDGITDALEVIRNLMESPSIPGDFDGSGVVDFSDFLAFAGAFGSTEKRFDLNGSGVVDFSDFLMFAQVFDPGAN